VENSSMDILILQWIQNFDGPCREKSGRSEAPTFGGSETGKAGMSAIIAHRVREKHFG